MVTSMQPYQLLCLDTVWILQELDGKNFFFYLTETAEKEKLS